MAPSGSPDVRSYPDARSFFRSTEAFLRSREDIENGLYASARLIAEGSGVFEGPFWFGSVDDRRGVVAGAGLHARPDGLLVSEVPVDALPRIFEAVQSAAGVPARILAPSEISRRLAECWRDSARPYHDSDWNVCRMDAPVPVRHPARGRLRSGGPGDRRFVRRWGIAYGLEKPAPLDVSLFLLRKLADGDLWIWDDEGARTIVTISGRTENGARISAVYTPPEFRGGGYASTAVAAISERLFADGCRFVTLLADSADPVNRMYRRLGFYVIGERSCFRLGTPR